jgi:hypothetical protein
MFHSIQASLSTRDVKCPKQQFITLAPISTQSLPVFPAVHLTSNLNHATSTIHSERNSISPRSRNEEAMASVSTSYTGPTKSPKSRSEDDFIDLSTSFINDHVQLENKAANDKELICLSKLTTRNAVKSPLLCLPGEIRNKIYAYVFTARSYVFANPSPPVLPGKKRAARKRQSTQPSIRHSALLAACRQTHHEAHLLPLLHATTFRIESLAALKHMYVLNAHQRSAITTLHMDLAYGTAEPSYVERFLPLEKEAQALMQLLPCLQKVYLNIGKSKHLYPAGYRKKQGLGDRERAKRLETWFKCGLGLEVEMRYFDMRRKPLEELGGWRSWRSKVMGYALRAVGGVESLEELGHWRSWVVGGVGVLKLLGYYYLGRLV